MAKKVTKDNYGYNKGLNFMNFLAVFLMAISVAYGAFYYSYFMNAVSIVNDKESEENDKDDTKDIMKSCDGVIRYSIVDDAKIYNSIELDKGTAADIYNSIDFKRLEKTQERDFVGFIEVSVCDVIVKIIQGDDIVIYDDKYYSLGDNYDAFSSLVLNIIDNHKFVGVYNLEKNITYSLLIDDLDKIREYVLDIENKVTNDDLAILKKYLLVVDDKYIYFDSFNGYAEYNGNIVFLGKELFLLLSESMVEKYDGGCCSCCPDLKPGESCIQMCCPCEYEKVEG